MCESGFAILDACCSIDSRYITLLAKADTVDEAVLSAVRPQVMPSSNGSLFSSEEPGTPDR
jgi:hypothetical protein